MAKEDLNYKVKIDTSGAVSDIETLNDAIEGTGESLKDAEKDTEKLNETIKETKGASETASKGLGGVLTSLKALAMNPFTIVLSALIGAFKTFGKMLDRNKGLSDAFDKAMARVPGTFNALLDVM